MNVHDPRDTHIPTQYQTDGVQAAPDSTQPSSAETDALNTEQCHQRLRLLRKLAGKTADLQSTDELRAFLTQSSEISDDLTGILTCVSPQPWKNRFSSYFFLESVESFRDEDGNPLPSVEVRVRNGQMEIIELSPTDPGCCSTARRDYVEWVLIRESCQRVSDALSSVFTPSEVSQATPARVQMLCELYRILSDKPQPQSPQPQWLPNTCCRARIIPADPAGVVSAPEGRRHITTLLMLAGKNGFKDPGTLQEFLFKNRDIAKLATELLTCTEQQPTGRSFDQLFPMESIEAYLTQDGDNHPLPGAKPRVCQGITRMVEIPWNDPDCNYSTRRAYLQSILIPAARAHVIEALQCLISPDELHDTTGGDIQELYALAKTLTATNPDQTSPHAGGFFDFLQHLDAFPCFHNPDPGPVPPPYAQ